MIFTKNILQMIKNFFLLTVFALLFSCKSDTNVQSDITDENQKFLDNCETVQAYLDDFVDESVDYKKYFNDTCKIRNTSFNSEGSMTVDDRISRHKKLWPKYDFSISDSINFLPGVNAETKQVDGSVRFYFNWTIINSENEKSVTVPLYMSFDFDKNGKFIFQQHFGDISAAFLSLEE